MQAIAPWIGLAASALSCALAVWVAIRVGGVERRMRRTLGLFQRQQNEQAQRDLERLEQQREALHESMRDMRDAIMGMMGETARIQQAHMEAFGSQMRTVRVQDEERMERLQAGIERRLGQYDRQMEQVTQTLERKLTANEQRVDQLRATLLEGMQRLQDGNAKKLDEIRVTVGEKLDETLDKRLNASFKLVSERLEQVYKGLGEMHALAEGVGDLKKVLTNVKTRGTWGEVQLGALLEQVLAPGQYETNVLIRPGSDERVEFAVCMPGKARDARVLLPIDAKFPLEDYRRLLEASDSGDPQRVEAAARALDATIRAEAKRIQTKYIDPPTTTDFAILYLPVEGLYAQALRRGDVVERLQRDHRIVLTGPTTLLALLNSLQMGFRTLAIEQRSSEVWALLGAVKAEFGRFSEILIRTQKRLRLASDSIEDATRKTQAIQRRLVGVQELSPQDVPVIELDDPAEELVPEEDL